MPDDAMELWQREVSGIRSDAGVRPAAGAHPPPGRIRPTDALAARLLIPAALGFALALYVMLDHGPGALVGPLMLVFLPLGAGAALLARREPPEVFGWSLLALFSGFATLVVLGPVLLFFDFLDCWFSWLSDC